MRERAAVCASYSQGGALAASTGGSPLRIDTTTWQSRNHDSRPSGISAIVIHSCEGAPPGNEQASSLPWLCSPNSGVSSHYYVTREGAIFQLVPDGRRAWHAGTSVLDGVADVNDFSLGVELEHRVGSAPYPPTQLDALAWLLNDKRDTYQIPLSRIVSHRAVARPSGRKGDPSDWPEPAFRAWVAALAKTDPAPHYTEQSPILARGIQPDAATVRAWIPVTGSAPQAAEIGDAYTSVCEAGRVEVALAVAQMLHETARRASFWAQYPRNNPAGIGVNGQTRPASDARPAPHDLWHLDAQAGVWRMGCAFTSWGYRGIRAQVGRLLAYTLSTEAQMTAQQSDLIDYALSVRALPDDARGSAQTIKQLGRAHNPSGFGWADPGDQYGRALARLANDLRGS